jgi:hypothetical protein
VVDHIRKRRHDAKLNQLAHYLCSGFLHTHGQIPDADFVGYQNFQWGLFRYFELEAVHTVALLLPPFCA